MTQSKNRASDSDAPQGADEERSETYKEYDEQVPESTTQRSAESDSSAAGSASRQASAISDSMEEAILFAKKYLEDLLSFFGLNTDVYATTEDNEVIELDIPSTHLNGFLIGQHGDTLRALQYTISNALKAADFFHTRVNVDVAGYKQHRAERIAKSAEEWFKEVRDSGQPKDLEPMNPADRRIIHKAAEDWGLASESVGEGRDRHIVLKPKDEKETN